MAESCELCNQPAKHMYYGHWYCDKHKEEGRKLARKEAGLVASRSTYHARIKKVFDKYTGNACMQEIGHLKNDMEEFIGILDTLEKDLPKKEIDSLIEEWSQRSLKNIEENINKMCSCLRKEKGSNPSIPIVEKSVVATQYSYAEILKMAQEHGVKSGPKVKMLTELIEKGHI